MILARSASATAAMALGMLQRLMVMTRTVCVRREIRKIREIREIREIFCEISDNCGSFLHLY